jgi:hypothetical protein
MCFLTDQTGSGAPHPSSYSLGTGVLFSGIKRPGREVDHFYLAPTLILSRVISLLSPICFRVVDRCSFTFYLFLFFVSYFVALPTLDVLGKQVLCNFLVIFLRILIQRSVF